MRSAYCHKPLAHECPNAISRCIAAFAGDPPGTAYLPSQASDIFRARTLAPANRTGGQTIARILVEHCGWVRQGRVVYKPAAQDTQDAI